VLVCPNATAHAASARKIAVKVRRIGLASFGISDYHFRPSATARWYAA
jgi:hypothetical protein